ncbi:FtsW/RodA/SpoVE family cell cycle protein, partial [bacterium]|nr:FtsW/RodA/SpoVE family cell cycle protein [bacterium]
VGFATMVMSGLLLLLKQPDFGGAFTLGCAVFALLSVAELSLAHIAWMTAIFTPLVAALIIMKPYRLARILAFLHPWGDPRGKGFQLIQSLIAVGSGGLWGRGISLSRQKYFYLPMQHTDFIFPIIAEETGFVGSTLLVVLFMLFLFFGFKILQLLEDRFSFYIVLGGVALISMRAAINLMVATGLLPTKGLGLPFVSYGGTALVANLFMVGLIINSVRTQKMMA